jgi:hypothetical protein
LTKEEKDCVARHWEENKKRKKTNANHAQTRDGSPRHSLTMMRRLETKAKRKETLLAVALNLTPTATATRNPRID